MNEIQKTAPNKRVEKKKHLKRRTRGVRIPTMENGEKRVHGKSFFRKKKKARMRRGQKENTQVVGGREEKTLV